MTAAFFLVAFSHLPSRYLIAGIILIAYGLIEFLIIASLKGVREYKLASAVFFLKPALFVILGIAFVVDNWGGYTGKAISVVIF